MSLLVGYFVLSWTQKTGNRTACQNCTSGTAGTGDIKSGLTVDIDCDGTAETGTMTLLNTKDFGGFCIAGSLGATKYNGCTAGMTGTNFCSQWGMSCNHGTIGPAGQHACHAWYGNTLGVTEACSSDCYGGNSKAWICY